MKNHLKFHAFAIAIVICACLLSGTANAIGGNLTYNISLQGTTIAGTLLNITGEITTDGEKINEPTGSLGRSHILSWSFSDSGTGLNLSSATDRVDCDPYYNDCGISVAFTGDKGDTLIEVNNYDPNGAITFSTNGPYGTPYFFIYQGLFGECFLTQSFGQGTCSQANLPLVISSLAVPASVPEPEAWGLMLSGSALVIAAVRRKKQA